MPDVQLQSFLRKGFEPAGLDQDRILAGSEPRQGDLTVLIGGRRATQIGLFIDDLDRRACDRAVLTVGHIQFERGVRHLSRSEYGKQKQNHATGDYLCGSSTHSHLTIRQQPDREGGRDCVAGLSSRSGYCSIRYSCMGNKNRAATSSGRRSRLRRRKKAGPSDMSRFGRSRRPSGPAREPRRAGR
jgi:hypothetical protein